MFETAELGHKIDKERYEKEEPKLREALLEAQFAVVKAARFPVIILINGVDGAGKGETVNLLNSWMDPRYIYTHGFGGVISDEERDRPAMWRYWRKLPPKGRLGILFGSWYTDPILQRVAGEISQSRLDQSISEIQRFERMLTDEGALVVKFWFHLSKKTQKKRLKELESDPKTRWRIGEQEWEHFKKYDKFIRVCEHTLRQTSSAEAPWLVVEGADERYRGLTVGTILLDRMQKHLERSEVREGRVRAAPILPPIDKVQVLKRLNMKKRLEKNEYERELEKYQGRLNRLCRSDKFHRHSAIVVMEGPDAAGKGGAIRRITAALDARYYNVIPVAAPTDEERAQPYLWRFWRSIPRHGRVSIFDRSWYGRVLVERVENFCSTADWMRAYSEIVDFEHQLAEHGTIIIKCWLAISREEQLRRFKERETIAYKQFKITPEDWRNRKKWGAYEQAVNDMVERTSTQAAPWHLIPANDKYYARVQLLKALCERIESSI